MIQYPGKARKLASECFGELAKNGGGVRLFLHDEQIVHIATYGLKYTMKDIARVCYDEQWSEKSSTKILNDFDNGINKAKLAMAMLEAIVVTDAGNVLRTSHYKLERDSSLILNAHEVLYKQTNMHVLTLLCLH